MLQGRYLEHAPPSFRSFFQAGFECSTHKRSDGTRLDLIVKSKHDRFLKEDFERVRAFDISTIRSAIRWHLVESKPKRYSFASLDPMLEAAEQYEIELLLDLLHFGWPDHLDIFSPDFPKHFGDFAAAAADHLRPYQHIVTALAPVNEISYLSWAGGDVGDINPGTIGRGHELKHILVRCAIAGVQAIRSVLPNMRLLAPEPVIHIVGNPERPNDDGPARDYTLAQFESWDMVSGRLHPELGGRPEYLDILGVNFYERNQWVNYGPPLSISDPRWRPFRQMLADVFERYRRPMIVAETGTEDDARADFFDYIATETMAARTNGIPVYGLCLYPICNHPGWADDRHCHNGLFDYADERGVREIHMPLAQALLRQQTRFQELNYDKTQPRFDMSLAPSLGLCLSTPSASDEPLRPDSESLLC